MTKKKTDNVVKLYGWVCPNCGKANSPFKSSCDCVQPIYVPVPYTPKPHVPWPYNPGTADPYPWYNPTIICSTKTDNNSGVKISEVYSLGINN